MTAVDYKKVFSKLSHIKALSHDDKFDQIVQNVILLTLFHSAKNSLKNEIEVGNKVNEIYGISIRSSVIQANLDKLISNGEIARDRSTKFFNISQNAASKLEKRLTEAQDLEMSVKKKWFEELQGIFQALDSNTLENFWTCLKFYLSNVFEQHGIQTIQLLNPNSIITEDDQKNLSSIVEKAIAENNCSFTKEDLSRAINQFIINADETRANYTSQLVDATFTSFALSADAEVVTFLNKRYSELNLFLDTNFIFGILDLHKNREDASAREILDEVRKNSLPFKLYYHPETLAEFKRTFDARALQIRASKWSKESSRLAIEIDGLSPLEELFHRENLENEVDPDIFLDKYNHVDLILKDLGLNEYIPYKTTDLEHGEIEADIANYQQFYDATPKRKSKSYYGFKHDIVVLREVRNLNPKKTKFLESKAFFVSSDFILAKFEKVYYKKNWEINYVVSPGVFLQLIRPFIQNDYTSNKRFIDTFSIPEFRSFEIDYSTTKSKTLQILNDSYHDTSYETKVKILRDQVLLEKLDKVTANYDSMVQIIENQIAIENKILIQKNQEADEKIKDYKKKIEAREIENQIVANEINLKNNEFDKLKHSSNQEKILLKKQILSEVNDSILKAEKSRIALQEIIQRKVKNRNTLFIVITILYYAILCGLIIRFSWDTMEPFTYIMSSLGPLIGYIYIAIKGDNFNPKEYFINQRRKITNEVYQKHNFDDGDLNTLRQKANGIREEIAKLETA